MRPNTYFAVAVVALAMCPGPAAHGAENGNGYIYDATSPGSNAALVIDRASRYVEVQNKDDVHMGAMLSDLGGDYENCGNNAFFCLTGALMVVIPKSMPMKHWQYHGLSCKSVSEPRGDAFRITCRSRNFLGRPAYTYSLSRGVLSIESSPVVGGRERFVLRGERGLFSPGNNP